MPKKKEPELTSEKQFKRFQEAAKEREIEKRLPKTEQDFIELAKKEDKPRKYNQSYLF